MRTSYENVSGFVLLYIRHTFPLSLASPRAFVCFHGGYLVGEVGPSSGPAPTWESSQVGF